MGKNINMAKSQKLVSKKQTSHLQNNQREKLQIFIKFVLVLIGWSALFTGGFLYLKIHFLKEEFIRLSPIIRDHINLAESLIETELQVCDIVFDTNCINSYQHSKKSSSKYYCSSKEIIIKTEIFMEIIRRLSISGSEFL